MLADLKDRCDLVLVDAPCSGTGTWRRNPETRWRMTPKRLDALILSQRQVLGLAARLCAPGGHILYAVCALTRAEGPEQIDAFLQVFPHYRAVDVPIPAGRRVGHGRMLTPCHDGSDGFFIARLEKTG